jgi:hypothetical protein
MARCDWTAPDDAETIPADARCVREEHDGDAHVVVAGGIGTLTYWRCNPETRTCVVVMHADYRDGKPHAEDEGVEAWQKLEADGIVG